ncbi:MAG: enoyl-CoA hydratase-related protein [Cytophagaceae bacterium]|nr:enoyl-CoA hydratase-related protein [Cytophagaceae bacterium]MDW8456280.1 enoyl-CoA hydratase-related protein [Cytophagaceae bacterium]
MSHFRYLKWEVEQGILTLTINRPDKLNALNFETLEELRTAMRNAYEEQSIKAIIITGEGSKSFVAGADITEFMQVNEYNARKISENGQEIFSMIEMCPKPVIAAVNGYALGGGCELAMACHMRIASTNAKFGLPEVSLGLLPGYGGTQRLTLLVGKGKAFELMMTGDMIDAHTALSIGLINHITSPEALIDKCKEILNVIMQRAPIAIAQVIECVNAVYNESKNGYQVEANSFAICSHTEDFREGTKAFLEKRKPVFKGR